MATKKQKIERRKNKMKRSYMCSALLEKEISKNSKTLPRFSLLPFINETRLFPTILLFEIVFKLAPI